MIWWRRGQTDEHIEKELRFHVDSLNPSTPHCS